VTEPTIPVTERTLPLSFGEKLLALYDRFKYVEKTGTNKHFSYRFMQESVLKRKLNEALRELGLVIVRTTVTPVGKCTGKAAVVKFEMTIADADDPTMDHVTLEGIGGGMDSGDKAPMKAVVAAMKYALANGLSIETGDDPEGDDTTDEAAVDEVLQRIADTTNESGLHLLKPQVVALKGGARFDEVKEAFRARMAVLRVDA
jgi:hypothetical protein